MLPASSPKLVQTGDAISIETNRLRKQLRSIKRFRRKSLYARAGKLESLLGELLNASQLAVENEIIQVSSAANTDLKNHVTTEEHQRILGLLDRSRQEYEELLAFMESEQAESSAEKDSQRVITVASEFFQLDSAFGIPRPFSNDPTVLHGQIEFLESELSKAHQATEAARGDEKDLRSQIEVLRTQLLESRHETIELRIQNAELSEQNQSSSQLLSWEQRKEQLLRELEFQSTDTDESDDANRIRRVIVSSQREIDQRDELIRERDREIEELQMLLTRQSTVTNGVAVGAAAIAQILDADEFIQNERDNLRRLQAEWEEKLRIAEIEISMERAKIARERSQNEVANATLTRKEEDQAAIEVESFQNSNATNRKRRWMSRLGIRDE
jgi:hypothetical protein